MAKKQKECVHESCSNKEPLEECPYCRYYYCNSHIDAKAPGRPIFTMGGSGDPILMSEWNEGNGHPCPEYIRYLIEASRRARASREAPEEETKEGKSVFRSALAFFASIVSFASRPVKWLSRTLNSFFYNMTLGIQHVLIALFAMSKIVLVVLVLLAAIWASNSLITYGKLPSISELNIMGNLSAEGNCTATWLSGACDPNVKPLFCSNGTVENRSSVCGCGPNLRQFEDQCIPKVICQDGTFSPECSANKPYQCINGTLVEKASKCGCVSESSFKEVGEICIDVSKTEGYAIEQKIHSLINVERQKNGLKALEADANLTEIARRHSQDMVENEYLEHTNLKGEGPAQRAMNAGYYCYKDYGNGSVLGSIGENIGLAYTFDTIYYANGIETNRDWYSSDNVAEMVVEGWMNSQGHRKNILTDTFEKEGIGVAISIEGRILITQDFC
jgi:uncharacterized protein YkwD